MERCESAEFLEDTQEYDVQDGDILYSGVYNERERCLASVRQCINGIGKGTLVMADDMARLEGKIDEMGRKLDKHIVESVEVRTKVDRHEELLGNGWAKDLSTDIQELKLKLARIEEQLLAKGHSWRELFFGLSLISLVIGMVLNAIKLYQM